VKMEDEVQAEDNGQQLWDEVAAEDNGEAPVTPPEQPKVEAKPAPVEDKPDPVAALQKQVEELSGLVKSSVGRIGALQSELAKRDAAPAPSHTQVAAAAKSTAKWSQLKTDFPDWAEAVEEFVSANAVQPVKPEDLIAQAKESVSSVATDVHVRTAKQLAAFAEPDWEEVAGSDGFNTWLQKQPAEYVARAAEASEKWDALKVVSVIRDFKKATATPPTPPKARGSANGGQSRLASAAVPSGSAATRKSVDDLDGVDYWKQLAQEERQQAA